MPRKIKRKFWTKQDAEHLVALLDSAIKTTTASVDAWADEEPIKLPGEDGTKEFSRWSTELEAMYHKAMGGMIPKTHWISESSSKPGPKGPRLYSKENAQRAIQFMEAKIVSVKQFVKTWDETQEYELPQAAAKKFLQWTKAIKNAWSDNALAYHKALTTDEGMERDRSGAERSA